jgi:hypothetical protein
MIDLDDLEDTTLSFEDLKSELTKIPELITKDPMYYKALH